MFFHIKADDERSVRQSLITNYISMSYSVAFNAH